MFRALQTTPILLLLLFATALEVSGDAIVRLGIYRHTGSARVALLLTGGLFLLGYGSILNSAPVDFGRVVGLYVATLFVVWQIITFLFFRTLPGLPVLLGGALIVAGGIVVTYWPTR